MFLGTNITGSHMGTLSHFVLEALLRKLIQKNVLTAEEVREVLIDAEASLQKIELSEHQAAFKALNETYIPKYREI